MARKGQFQPGQSGNPSGRKPRAHEERFLKVLVKVMPAKRWAIVMEKVALLAERGEKWAVEYYANYMMGKPRESVDITTDGEKISVIEVIKDNGTGQDQ